MSLCQPSLLWLSCLHSVFTMFLSALFAAVEKQSVDNENENRARSCDRCDVINVMYCDAIKMNSGIVIFWDCDDANDANEI